MITATVTVFVKRTRLGWDASTINAEAQHPNSATLAARRCAAKHFLVSEERIDLLPSTEHIMIASVRTGVRPNPPSMLVAAGLIALAGTAFLMLFIWLISSGGAS